MPGFLYNVVTQAGAALIAQATAANQIVFVAALSKSTAATSAEELAVQPASWYDGKAGGIAAASATDNVARVVASWQPSGSRQAAKAMCVTARLASQTDAQAVPVIALSDPDSTIELPGADDTGGAVSIPFLADINASGDVEATPGAAASIADLARFVSLHSAGNPTAGDNQTILGDKSFSDDVAVAGDLSVGGQASFAGQATFAGGVKADSIAPITTGANARVSIAGGINVDAIGSVTANAPVRVVPGIRTDQVMQYGGFTIDAPWSTSSYYPFASVKVGFGNPGAADEQVPRIEITTATDGSSSSMHTWIFRGDTLTKRGTSMFQLGESDNRNFRIYCAEVYWSECHGMLPHPADDTHIPEVGSILLVKISAGTPSSGVAVVRRPGDYLSVDGSEITGIAICDFQGTNTDPVSLVTYEFRMLSYVAINPNGWDLALVMRSA